jgi:hypothetical protein
VEGHGANRPLASPETGELASDDRESPDEGAYVALDNADRDDLRSPATGTPEPTGDRAGILLAALLLVLGAEWRYKGPEGRAGAEDAGDQP